MLRNHIRLAALSIAAVSVTAGTLYTVNQRASLLEEVKQMEEAPNTDTEESLEVAELTEAQLAALAVGELSDDELAELMQNDDGITTYTDENGITVILAMEESAANAPSEEALVGDTGGEGGSSGGTDTARPTAQCTNPPPRSLTDFTHTESMQHVNRAVAMQSAVDAVRINVHAKCETAAAVGAPACQAIEGPPRVECRTRGTRGVFTPAPATRTDSNPKILRVSQVEVLREKVWQAAVQIRGTCTVSRTCQQ